MSETVQIPHRFIPRPYQLPLLSAMEQGCKRAVCVLHRRAGKDKLAINVMIREMVKRVGSYYYVLPTYSQGRKIVWEGIDKDGMRFLDHFPPDLVRGKNDTEMKIELVNGSVFRVIGSDNYDSIVGTNPVGVVFSEYALQNPLAWDYIRPILRENGGWAIFISTPRGHNHLFDILQVAKDNGWFWQVLSVADTGVLTPADIEEERRAGMDDDLIQQEFYVSFDASIKGAYYSSQIKDMREQGRLCKVPYEKNLPVHTSWDLGIGDSTAIIFYQLYGQEVRIIDFEEHSGEGIAFYASVLQKKGYKYGTHFFPHDAAVKELGTGKSRIEVAHTLGIRPTVILPIMAIEDGIQAVREAFPRFWIDQEKCKFLIEALTQYHKEYDEDKRIFKDKPLHDWSSHAADAARYLATALPRDPAQERRKKARSANRPWWAR